MINRKELELLRSALATLEKGAAALPAFTPDVAEITALLEASAG